MGPESLTTFIFNPRFDNDLTVISGLTAMTKKMGHRATRFEDLVQTEVRAVSCKISAFSGRHVASSNSFCYDNFSPIFWRALRMARKFDSTWTCDGGSAIGKCLGKRHGTLLYQLKYGAASHRWASYLMLPSEGNSRNSSIRLNRQH